LCHLIGTPFEPSFKGHILLLEDRGEASYSIDRMLTQMKIAGCFDGLAGLALGAFKDCVTKNDIFSIVDNIFNGYTLPILAGFDVGHGKSNITIPIGVQATLDADRHILSYHEPATVI
jgi:muramoyltetrapeptide carboxypeptidase